MYVSGRQRLRGRHQHLSRHGLARRACRPVQHADRALAFRKSWSCDGPAGGLAGPHGLGHAGRAYRAGQRGCVQRRDCTDVFTTGVDVLDAVSCAAPQMDSILPERLLALVRPAFDLVLRRIRSLKRCAQACGCKIMTPRYACKMPSSQTKPARQPARSQTKPARSQTKPPEAKPNQPEAKPTTRKPARSQPEAKPSQPEAKPSQPEANQKSQPRFPLRALTLQKQRQLLGILPNRISRGHYFAATRLHAAF